MAVPSTTPVTTWDANSRSASAASTPLAGQTVRVYVHNSLVAATRVSGSGGAYLHQHSTPAITQGDAIRLRTHSGHTVASGTFHRFGHHM